MHINLEVATILQQTHLKLTQADQGQSTSVPLLLCCEPTLQNVLTVQVLKKFWKVEELWYKFLMVSSRGIDDLPSTWDREELAISIVKPAQDKEENTEI